jgi:hypothetical protein
MRHSLPLCYSWPPDQDLPALQYQEPLTKPQYHIPEDLNPHVKSVKLVTLDILTAVAMNHTVYWMQQWVILRKFINSLEEHVASIFRILKLYQTIRNQTLKNYFLHSHCHENLRNPWYCPFIRWLSYFISNHKQVPHICQTPPNSLCHIPVPSYHKSLCMLGF